MQTIRTARLVIRQFTLADGPFVMQLVNQPSWLQWIGNRNVHTLNDAETYISSGPMAMYQRYGVGLCGVELAGTLIGMAGLIKRTPEAEIDLGYAFLPEYWGQGYASEVAQALLNYAITTLKLPRIIATTHLENKQSIKVLERIGMHFEGIIHEGEQQLRVFGYNTRRT
ncbi:GNAT family N-acetyltransferase [Herpetosiphon giganteus]|uniref:GNAT family N-acetyltransferase n=1 Tax=Herpetosiphon giganteus TaxID=2029754 RepID=UPI001956F749|nr:GNAT family N-acetyltransferase [Herpetosiphon giganteus]MBM7844146.1 RimJ/RimL family protein N-acetyltransferase [Herpetosiphon giganteus]